MAGTKISDYQLGDSGSTKWSNFLTTIEKQRKGYNGISLTNYDNSSLPAIAAGSYVEISGAFYGFSSEEAIGGTPTSGSTNYIYIDPSTVTATWTTTAPTWSTAKNGVYDAGETNRYIGGCYYDGTNYTGKWVYTEGQLIPGEATKYYSVPMVGSSQSGVAFNGSYLHVHSGDGTCDSYLPVHLPNGAEVIDFYTNVYSFAATSITCYLIRALKSTVSTDNLVTNTHTSTGAISGNTITNGIVDNQNYAYYVSINVNSPTSDNYILPPCITYTITKSLP